MDIAANNLLNLITWLFIGLTILVFLWYTHLYRPRFRKVYKDLKKFDISEPDSATSAFATLFNRYKEILRNNRTSE